MMVEPTKDIEEVLNEEDILDYVIEAYESM